MHEDTVIRLAVQTLETALLIGAPMLIVGLVVGVIISVIQIVTSIHDTTLAFVPRIVITLAAFLVAFPWMMTRMVSFTQELFSNFEVYTR
jgi:flagellar biosynthetic protein FliQ